MKNLPRGQQSEKIIDANDPLHSKGRLNLKFKNYVVKRSKNHKTSLNSKISQIAIINLQSKKYHFMVSSTPSSSGRKGVDVLNLQQIEDSLISVPSVFDITTYILARQPTSSPITTWKLQKLLYYCQAWSLVWAEKPLFNEKIFAWANGPVIPELYTLHKGEFHISSLSKGENNNLNAKQKETVDHVLEAYGNKTAQWLSDLTHMEKPWIQARKGLQPGQRGNREITLASMYEYYSSLDESNNIL